MTEGYADSLEKWLSGAGEWGPLLFILLYAAATVAFLPASPLTIISGAIFGLWKGMLLSLLGANLGATLSFLLARGVLRKRVAEWAARHPRVGRIDRAISNEGGKIVALLRLSPIFPFSLLNYVIGLSGIPLATYVWVTFVFMIPATFLYVSLGSFGREASFGTDPVLLLWHGAGLVATVLATVYITRLARRELALAEEAHQKEG